jgi:hypothetical protein
VFEGMTDRTEEMLRVDLEAAGVAYEAASGVANFHASRAAYVSNLVASGASVKTCQTSARHSTPTLTIGVDAKVSLHDIKGAVESLPDLTPTESGPEALAITGTDPVVTPISKGFGHHLATGGDGSGRELPETGVMMGSDAQSLMDRNPLEMSGLDASGRVLSGMPPVGLEPTTR